MTPLRFEILPYFRGWLGKSAFDEFTEYFIHVLKSKRFFSCHITNNSLNFIFQKNVKTSLYSVYVIDFKAYLLVVKR